MEINVGKTKVMRISRQPSPVHVMTDQKQSQNVEYFKYFGGLETSDVHVKLNSGLHGTSSIQQEDSFHQQIGLKFKEEISKC